MISPNDIVVVHDLSLTPDELAICRQIASHTTETWQTNRTPEARLKDTCIGKFAEKALKQYFANECHANINPFVAFYDDFRVDDFHFHNSIDLLFSTRVKHLLDAQNFIQTHLSTSNSKLTVQQRNRFRAAKVCIGEIKATRVTSRLIKNGQVSLSDILRDDFLAYPAFTRKSSISNKDEYLAKFSAERNLTKLEILEKEKESLSDWYFRVYIKENPNNVSTCDAYIVGALPGTDFITHFNIKKMVQSNKSEDAVYLSVPLNQGTPIKDFKIANIPTTPFRNHLTSYAPRESPNNHISNPSHSKGMEP